MGLELVSVISSYLNKKPPTLELTQALVSDAKSQGLGALLFLCFKSDKIKSLYFNSFILNERFVKLANFTSSILNKNQIKHLFFKGSVLYKLYDDSAIRSRGDIDLYVDPKDFDKTITVLQNAGFTKGEVCNHHIVMLYDGLEVEVHFSLFDPQRKKYIKYFKNPFLFAICKNEYMYEFKIDYHFIYCLVHFANHLECGSGLRYLLDFYYMLKKEALNLEFIKEELQKLNLYTFYKNVINAVYKISGMMFDDVEQYDVNFFLEYLNDSGTYGFKANPDGKIIPRNKLSYIINSVFLLNKNERIERYPVLGKHWFLYPVLLICRIFYLITHKVKGFLRIVFKRRNKKQEEILRKIGL